MVVKSEYGKGPRKSVFECSYRPLWAVSGVKGRRSEMEDSFIVIPNFIEVPIGVLMNSAPKLPVENVMAHLFGVFDGHGGSQVAEHCRGHISHALHEELTTCKAFAANNDIVPHDVGSTAVAAILTCSHIIVANCGDSRAVLSRGHEAIELSSDHKPDRMDEKLRIEAAGGTVIDFHGARVFGVLAMSRAIGDLGLKDWVICDPEVTITPRSKDDNCIIIASDGFWDVITSQDACCLAKKFLYNWHKKNPGTVESNGCDPACQAAATFLTNLALKKGSTDNITIIVIDFLRGRIKN